MIFASVDTMTVALPQALGNGLEHHARSAADQGLDVQGLVPPITMAGLSSLFGGRESGGRY
jgi:hypothetical protein